jgi:hypothetical protein
MRFGNSAITLVWEKVTARKALLDAAFHDFAARISRTETMSLPCAGFSTATISAFVICSKVTRPGRRAAAATSSDWPEF